MMNTKNKQPATAGQSRTGQNETAQPNFLNISYDKQEDISILKEMAERPLPSFAIALIKAKIDQCEIDQKGRNLC